MERKYVYEIFPNQIWKYNQLRSSKSIGVIGNWITILIQMYPTELNILSGAKYFGTYHRYVPHKLIVICNIKAMNLWRYSWLNCYFYTKVISLKRLIRVIRNAWSMHECIDQKNSTIWETIIEFSSLCRDFLWSHSLSKEST